MLKRLKRKVFNSVVSSMDELELAQHYASLEERLHEHNRAHHGADLKCSFCSRWLCSPQNSSALVRHTSSKFPRIKSSITILKCVCGKQTFFNMDIAPVAVRITRAEAKETLKREFGTTTIVTTKDVYDMTTEGMVRKHSPIF